MRMKLVSLSALLLLGLAANSLALGTTFSAYGTYWKGDYDEGLGGGVRLKKSLLDILSVDGRGGYVDFDSATVKLVPLEASLNIGLPGPITPYAGVGAGYYLVDAKNDHLDDLGGYFAQVGIEVTLFKIGALAELRYLDVEKDYFDGFSANVGLLLKW